jgi:hypothetical protein
LTSDAKTRAASLPLRQSRRHPAVAYGYLTAGEPHFRAAIHAELDRGACRVCDVGGGAKPVVALAEVERRGLDYIILDASWEELDKAPSGYKRMGGDVLDRDAMARFALDSGPFDLVISRWTAEHMRSGEDFHRNVFQMLRPGGAAVHYFPTLYALPFLVNRILAEERSSRLLTRAFPRRHVKFPAYYSWCRGPTRRQLRRLQGLGYAVERYAGFFGHDFYRSMPPVAAAHRACTRLLVRYPVPSLTSFALVVLRRPADAGSSGVGSGAS